MSWQAWKHTKSASSDFCAYTGAGSPGPKYVLVPFRAPFADSPLAGHRFNTRGQHVTDVCLSDEPVMQQVGDSDHYLACQHPVEASALVG